MGYSIPKDFALGVKGFTSVDVSLFDRIEDNAFMNTDLEDVVGLTVDTSLGKNVFSGTNVDEMDINQSLSDSAANASGASTEDEIQSAIVKSFDDIEDIDFDLDDIN